MGAQRVRVAARAAPHVRVQAACGNNLVCARRQEVEDPELGGREADARLAPANLVCLRIERQPIELKARLSLLFDRELRAAEHGTNASHELPELERLRHEVVCAEVEGAEDVLGVSTTGENEDRSLAVPPDLAQHLEPIEGRQAEIENHEVRPVGPPAAERLRAVACLGDYEPLPAEYIRGQVEHVGVVLDEQKLDHFVPHSRFVLPRIGQRARASCPLTSPLRRR